VSQHSRELYLALATALVIAIIYVLIAQGGVPRSSGFLGHGLGIVGFALMLGAEVLYSWRKQKRGVRYGRLNTWLQAHIYLGLVGPFLVLLHSAWKLNGLAGATMLLTLLMVATGFLCSYIYTAMPRTADGAELAMREVENNIAATSAQLQLWTAGKSQPMATQVERLINLTGVASQGRARSVLWRGPLHWRYQRRLRRELRHMDAVNQQQVRELADLLDRRYLLTVQAQTLASARKLLGQSRTIHIVLGVVLFALAFVHIAAALYYATFAR
jgi:hypothetical protein